MGPNPTWVTDTGGHPTAAARDLIGALAPVIAYAVDPMRSTTAAARIITNVQAGVVVTRGGSALPRVWMPTRYSLPVRLC